MERFVLLGHVFSLNLSKR